MELKAFKGMPHEFGGIDYTEGSEVEGGEFAVQIGKNGNEYIFDKNSSEGERLSKEYKRLDKNGRLTEDDPLALETFDQIAREEAIRHAQRSVNEKGIDPFRNMYEQGGQAANGGVKYATGGPMMNPAEVPNVNPGAQYNTSMSYAPMTMEDYNRQTQGESRMRDSFGTQTMRERETDKAFKEATPQVEMAAQALDVMFGQIVTSFGGESPGAMLMADMGYTSSDATKRAVGDDTMTGTAYGYGQAQSKDVITSMGDSFFGKEGGAMPKDKYAQGGAKDMYAMGGGMPWMEIVKAVKAVKGQTRGLGKAAIDDSISSKFGEEYVRQPLSMPGGTSGGGFAMPQKQKQPQEETEDFSWVAESNDPNSPLFTGPETYDMYMQGDPNFVGPPQMGANAASIPQMLKNGGAKPIYGYYADGGGKDKEDEVYYGKIYPEVVIEGTNRPMGPTGAEGDVNKGKEIRTSSDYNFSHNKSFSELEGLLDLGAYLYNINPYSNKGTRKDAIDIRIPEKEGEQFVKGTEGVRVDNQGNPTTFTNNEEGNMNILPSNVRLYLSNFFGFDDVFTEKDLTPGEYKKLREILAKRTVKDEYLDEYLATGGKEYIDENNISYDDYNRFGASSIYENTPRHLYDNASILKTLIGKGSVSENYYKKRNN